jgi:hypothetical protein
MAMRLQKIDVVGAKSNERVFAVEEKSGEEIKGERS